MGTPERQLDDRPDLEAGLRGGGGAAQQDAGASAELADERGVEGKIGFIHYASAGQQFTAWFNGMLNRTSNPTIRLGTKTASVVALHPEGRLEVEVRGEGEDAETQFVAFESGHMDQLLLKFAAAARA